VSSSKGFVCFHTLQNAISSSASHSTNSKNCRRG